MNDTRRKKLKLLAALLEPVRGLLSEIHIEEEYSFQEGKRSSARSIEVVEAIEKAEELTAEAIKEINTAIRKP